MRSNFQMKSVVCVMEHMNARMRPPLPPPSYVEANKNSPYFGGVFDWSTGQVVFLWTTRAVYSKARVEEKNGSI
jgi:hypothetical protein